MATEGERSIRTARIVRVLWRFVRPHSRLLLLGTLAMPVMIAFELANPMVLKIAIDDYIKVGRSDGLLLIIGVFVALILGRTLVELGQTLLFMVLGQRAAKDLRVSLYGHELRQRASYFDRVPLGQVVSRITADVDDVSEAVSSGVFLIAVDIVRLLAIVAFMFHLNVRLALACLAAGVALGVPIRLMRRALRDASRAERAALGALSGSIFELVGGMRVVQAFRREPHAGKMFAGRSQALRDATIQAVRAEVWLFGLIESIATIGAAIIVFQAGGDVQDAISVGMVVAFIEYVNKAQIPVQRIVQRIADAQAAMASAERIVHALEEHEPDAPVSEAHATEPVRDEALVRFENVDFAYRDGEPVLRDLSFEVARGESVAIVGPTGSGKSSVIKLLIRLYEPSAGSVRCFGRDVRGFRGTELRKRIAVVSQDAYLFSGTIADNVSLADESVSRDQVEDALRRVGADRALARKGATADDMVAERGSNVSGGEKQLIAFARAIVRDPEVLVLDEATAHIDPESEKLIETGLATLMAERTCIVIAHRLATARRADRILVISEGRLVESGTRQELLARGGLYAALEGQMLD